MMFILFLAVGGICFTLLSIHAYVSDVAEIENHYNEMEN